MKKKKFLLHYLLVLYFLSVTACGSTKSNDSAVSAKMKFHRIKPKKLKNLLI